MDELIVLFYEERYLPELQVEIQRSFRLLDQFQYAQKEKGFIELLTNDSYMEVDDLQDQFITLLNEKIQEVIEAHEITTRKDASIYELNELAEALYRLQYLEDYNGVYNTLISQIDSDAKLITILEEFCDLSDIELNELIIDFNENVLDSLKVFAESRLNENDNPVNMKIVERFILFQKYLSMKNEHTLGESLVESGMYIGALFETYKPFVTDLVLTDNSRQTALNVLSTMLLAEDTYENPVLAFREHSASMFESLDLISKIEQVIIAELSELDNFIKSGAV